MVESVASAEVISEETQNNKGQLNLFYSEAELSDKSNLSEEKQKAISQIEELFGIDCSSTILPGLRELSQEDVDKLKYMGNQGLTITKENIFSLLSNKFTDDEIKKLVEFQNKGVELTRDVVYQLASSTTESEKNQMLEKMEFYNYLSEDSEDAWLLSNMDSLLEIYPLWKIKGLYLYRKLIDYHIISDMSEFSNSLDSDQIDGVLEERIEEFSALTLNQCKIIEQIGDIFGIDIYPNIQPNYKELISGLAHLSQENVDILRSRKEYIQELFGFSVPGEGYGENYIEWDTFGPVALMTQEQWNIVDNIREVLKIKPSIKSLPLLAKLSQEDVDKLKHFKELGFEINEKNILLLASLELNEGDNEIKSLLELQRNGIDITADVTDRLDEYIKIGDFLSELGNEKLDIWIKSHVNELLKRKRNGHKCGLYEIKGVYYFHKLTNMSNRDIYEYVDTYERIYSNTHVLEFISKMGLEGEFHGVVFYELVKEIPLEVLKFVQENMGRCSYSEVSRLGYFFRDRHNSAYLHRTPGGSMECYNYDLENDGERIDSVLQVIKKFYLEKGIQVTSDTLLGLLKFVLSLNLSGPLLRQYFESGEITTDDMKKICDILGKLKK